MQEVRKSIQEICHDLYGLEVDVVMTRPDAQFGDFATNVALQLSKRLGKNPRDIAQRISDKLSQTLPDIIRETAVAGPGFINIRLTDGVLLTYIDRNGAIQELSGKKVLVEYSDPNPLKPLHAGHLYTTIVGDAIARLVERSGAQVIRLNYGGDVGLHVGKSIWAIIKTLGGENPDKLRMVAEADRAQWLGARYVEGNNAYEDNEIAKQEIIAINRRIYAIHAEDDHESDLAKVYWAVRQWSYDYFAQLYEQLDVTPFDRFIPESEVTQLGVQTVEAHRGTVYVESDGAVIFEGEPLGLHNRVFINSEGLPTYEAKEVGLLETKWKEYAFDTSIVITANEQQQYMEVVLKSIEQFQPEPIQRTKHITHGVVKLAGGVKMSSRKGNIVSALDILEAARVAGEDTGRANDESIVLAAVKYAFLKNRIGADVVYDPKESIMLEGNSGPYLQYAHARARSILSKAVPSGAGILTLEPGERSLALKLTEYPEVIHKATSELLPHLICTYLYELAQTFNRFYENNRVIGDARETERLVLLSRYADILKDGLGLLGVTAPEQM